MNRNPTNICFDYKKQKNQTAPEVVTRDSSVTQQKRSAGLLPTQFLNRATAKFLGQDFLSQTDLWTFTQMSW